MKRIYLDNNATTMVDSAVKDAMDPFFCEMYGIPILCIVLEQKFILL